ncbi:hypothetical protein T4B_1356 [Trichinella pseudospiralis]|uniref:Uncharacterized protein n=1 Tax=Trichinella pseudospiralis TaxID=6337 RepID=A0A0V1GHJ2_TRIPS|nr:hypothetical protein T4B_1356 [Trichinella pseudospiralis]
MLIHYEYDSFFKISREVCNQVNPELACFAKNGEKHVFKIWTFFDCYIFILINYCILESLSERNSVVVE